MNDERGDNVERFPQAVLGAVKKMQAEMDGLIEYQQLMARLHREKFDALLQQGFDKKQALELSKDVWPGRG